LTYHCRSIDQGRFNINYHIGDRLLSAAMYYMPFSPVEVPPPKIPATTSLSQDATTPEPEPPLSPFKLRNDTTLTRRWDTYPFIDPQRFRHTLRGQVVLITNAARGIGRASALDFASAGATLVLTARDIIKLHPVLSEIKERYQTPAYALQADFTDPDVPLQLVQNVTKSLGGIDVLLNITHGGPISSFEIETDFLKNWWSSVELELRAPIALIHAVVKQMTARGRGTIITTTKPTAFLDVPFTSADSASSAAMIRFHQSLAYEVKPKGVVCFAVYAGMVASHLYDPEQPIPPLEHREKDPRIEADFAAIIADRLGKQPQWCGAGLSSGTFLALAADPRTRCLSGMYINAETDLGEVVADAELGLESRTVKERLYKVNLAEL
jgi:NAD(P)-dependent dehydrogenase (short-subunit alcohol dehydrogenase family)